MFIGYYAGHIVMKAHYSQWGDFAFAPSMSFHCLLNVKSLNTGLSIHLSINLFGSKKTSSLQPIYAW
jgi:hypothetical protein